MVVTKGVTVRALYIGAPTEMSRAKFSWGEEEHMKWALRCFKSKLITQNNARPRNVRRRVLSTKGKSRLQLNVLTFVLVALAGGAYFFQKHARTCSAVVLSPIVLTSPSRSGAPMCGACTHLDEPARVFCYLYPSSS